MQIAATLGMSDPPDPANALGAQRPNLTLRVLAFERGQIHHADREIECPELGFAFDRARLELGDTLLDTHLVDSPDALHDRLDAIRPAHPGAHESACLALC